MIEIWRKFFRREAALTLPPGGARPRTWSAQSGYVYEYTFAGFRRTTRSGEAFVEYVFSATGGREPLSTIAVLLPEQKVRDWAAQGRELTASERYGIAKLVLKNVFDRAPNPKLLPREHIPDRSEIGEIAELLDL